MGSHQNLPEGIPVLRPNQHTMNQKAADALNKHFGKNDPMRDWGRKLERLKKYNTLSPNSHDVLHSNGDFSLDGKLIGNISNF